MRLGTVSEGGVVYPFILRDDQRHTLRDLAGFDLRTLVAMEDAVWRATVASSLATPTSSSAVAMPPLRPGKIIAIGLNYMDHVRETGLPAPEVPLVFAKFPSCLAADGDEIIVDATLTARVDWEVELAVVIGRGGRGIPADRALEHVFGYTVANDLSARDVQFSDGQWTRGKSMDGFCPLGPFVVTRDELPDPQNLSLRTTVNGVVMQQSSTREMVFGVAELIAFCSRNFRLDSGDVILTGTPWGCGEFMEPKVSLQRGDRVEVSVEEIGALTNTIGAVN